MAYLTISDDFLSTHTTYSYRIVPNAMLDDNLITALEEECIQRLDSQKVGKDAAVSQKPVWPGLWLVFGFRIYF